MIAAAVRRLGAWWRRRSDPPAPASPWRREGNALVRDLTPEDEELAPQLCNLGRICPRFPLRGFDVGGFYERRSTARGHVPRGWRTR